MAWSFVGIAPEKLGRSNESWRKSTWNSGMLGRGLSSIPRIYSFLMFPGYLRLIKYGCVALSMLKFKKMKLRHFEAEQSHTDVDVRG